MTTPCTQSWAEDSPGAGQGQELDLMIFVDPFQLRIFCDFNQEGEAGLGSEPHGLLSAGWPLVPVTPAALRGAQLGTPVQESPCPAPGCGLMFSMWHHGTGALGSSGGEQRSSFPPWRAPCPCSGCLGGPACRCCPSAPCTGLVPWAPFPSPSLTGCGLHSVLWFWGAVGCRAAGEGQ